MRYVNDKLKKKFILALKSNRLVALSEKEKKQGNFTRIDELDWSKKKPIKGWIRGLEFSVLIHRQVFTNKDGSIGVLYLITNDLSLEAPKLEAIYQQRWCVEVFHKNIKSNTALAKSPTSIVRTQSNHIFMSIYASTKLEILAIKHKINTFALRSKLYISTLKTAFEELGRLKFA